MARDDGLIDIVRILPDVVFRCERRADGRIVWTLNEGRLAEEFHLTTAEVAGKTLEEMFPPDVVERIRPHFEAAFRGETHEFTNVLGGRHFRHVPQPVRDATGKVVAVVGFISEVTSLVEAREAVRELNAELLERIRQLSDANQALERANAELDAYGAAVSHDLRGALSVVRMGAASLRARGVPPDAERLVQRIDLAALRMEERIAALLELAHATRRREPDQDVDVTRMARDVAAEWQAANPARQVVWGIPDGLRTRGDPRLLRAVLENLLGNAAKYSVVRPVAHVELRQRHEGGQDVFEVADDGIGFDPADAPKLFQPFSRLAPGIPGHGLGLATVHRAVAALGGRVWAEGHPGEGSTFRFSVPAA